MKSRFAAAVLVLPLLAACNRSALTPERDPKAEATVYRTYAKNVEEVWKSVREACKELDLMIDKGDHDALGGELTARRANKDRVEIDMKVVDSENTQVAVLVNPGDRNMANVVQGRIASKLGVEGRMPGTADLKANGKTPEPSPGADLKANGNGKAPEPSPGAGVAQTTFDAGEYSTVEGAYAHSVSACVAAAEKAMAALKLPVTSREAQESWGRIDSWSETKPAQIRVERKNRGETRVVFSAGRARNTDNQGLAEKLKTEFEKALR